MTTSISRDYTVIMVAPSNGNCWDSAAVKCTLASPRDFWHQSVLTAVWLQQFFKMCGIDFKSHCFPSHMNYEIGYVHNINAIS